MLICSFVFSFSAELFAGGNVSSSHINSIYWNLSSACNIVSGSQIYTDLQNARYYLSQAQRLLRKNGTYKCFDHRLMRTIEKAKTQILWNDREDAVEYICRAMQIVENGAGSCPDNSNQGKSGNSYSSYSGNSGYSTGAMIAAPVVIGFGALLASWFGGFGNRIPMHNVPNSVIRVR